MPRRRLLRCFALFAFCAIGAVSVDRLAAEEPVEFEVKRVRADPVLYFSDPEGAPAGSIPKSVLEGARLKIGEKHANGRFEAYIPGHEKPVWLDPRQVQIDEERARAVYCDRLAAAPAHGVRMASRFHCP